jgi:hypothetical protein
MFFDENKGVMNPSFFKFSDFLWDGCDYFWQITVLSGFVGKQLFDVLIREVHLIEIINSPADEFAVFEDHRHAFVTGTKSIAPFGVGIIVPDVRRTELLFQRFAHYIQHFLFGHSDAHFFGIFNIGVLRKIAATAGKSTEKSGKTNQKNERHNLFHRFYKP